MRKVILIAAVDDDLAIAREGNTPWDVPSDRAMFRARTLGKHVLLGRKTAMLVGRSFYKGRTVIVASRQNGKAHDAQMVADALQFIESFKGELWVGGGQDMFEAALSYADELYLTRVAGSFGGDRFFPQFAGSFQRISRGRAASENGLTYCTEHWMRH